MSKRPPDDDGGLSLFTDEAPGPYTVEGELLRQQRFFRGLAEGRNWQARFVRNTIRIGFVIAVVVAVVVIIIANV